MLRSLRARGSDEQGSVMMALLAVVVGGIAVASLAATVHAGLNSSRVDENRINAFQHANAGIDLALYRIDRNDFSGVVTTSTGFTDSITVAGSRFDVVADRTYAGSNSTWTVRSTGIDPSGKRRLAIATIGTEQLFSSAFFVVNDFSLTGNQSTPVAYDSSTCPTGAASCDVVPNPGRLGTNSTIGGSAVGHFKDLWNGFDMYGRTSQAAADDACGSGACGTAPKVGYFANQLAPDVPTAPAGALPCPSGGHINGGTLMPNDYVCNNLVMTGTVTIGSGGNGSGRVRIWVSGSFSATAVVNRYQVPAKFQVFQPEAPGGGPNGEGDICDGEIWGLLYTPGLSIDCHGSHQPVIYGAVVAQLHRGTGNHFDFHYDIRAAEVTRDNRFTVRDWRECPPGATDC